MNEHIIKQNHELTRRRQVISKLFLVNSKDEEIKDSVSERKNTGKEEILAGYREVILSSSTDEIVQKFIQIKEEKTSLSQPVWFLELVLKLKKQGMDILVNSILPIDAESNHFVLDTVWGSEALSQFFELKKELTYDEMRSLSRSIFNYRSCTEMIKSARTSNIDMKQLAKAMFAENKGVYVFQNTQYFKDLDQSWLLKMAIKTGNIEYLISRIKDFSFSTAELAMIEQDALKNSCVESLIAAESSFPDADRDLILQKLIDNGNMRLLSDELDYFSSCNRTVIAEAFIENYRIYYLFENFDFFKQIRAELLLEKIVDSGHGHDVFTYIDYFESYDTDKFIELLLAKKKFGSLIRCLSKTESSINVLDVLEKAMEGNQISVDHLYKVWGYLKEIDPDVLMRLCLKYNYQGFVVKKLSHFPNANITMLLESMGEDKLIYCFLEWSEKLSQDQLKKVLVATIHTEFHNEVFRYWSNLSDHHNMIIDEFWNCELNYPLSSHMDVIMHSNIDFKRLGERFLEASQFEIIRKYSETFHQVDKKKLAETILSSNSYFDVDIMYYFKYLDPTAKMKYLNKFISVYPDVMLTHFSLFKDIDRSSVADDFRSLELDTQKSVFN